MKKLPPTQIIQRKLLNWFSKNRRDLPWRNLPAGRQGINDPYLIAVSEVMLQQTQVDRVIPKFNAWRRAWPTTESLARAPLSEVLQMWSGLGYNSRAKRLRDAAIVVTEKFNGQWPRTIEELESLPGFGPYTARAAASFSRNENVAVIDTNVRRVVGRIFFGLKKHSVQQLDTVVQKLLPKNRSAEWNATLMDFGSAICVGRRPKCEICPVQQYCVAYPKILTYVPEKKTSVIKFKETDRYWRGEIVRQFLQQSPQSLITIRMTLKKMGMADVPRISRLIKMLIQDGLIQQTGKMIRIAK